MPPKCVSRRSKDRDLRKSLRDVQRAPNRQCADTNELITHVNVGLIAWSARYDVSRHDMLVTIASPLVHPGDSVVMKLVRSQMLKAEHCSYSCRDRAYQQQSTRELVFSLAHVTFGSTDGP